MWYKIMTKHATLLLFMRSVFCVSLISTLKFVYVKLCDVALISRKCLISGWIYTPDIWPSS